MATAVTDQKKADQKQKALDTALTQIERESPNGILARSELGDMSGWELASMIRRDPNMAQIRLLLLANDEEEVAALVASFSELRLSTKEKADEKGTLYGSVGAAAIAKLMTEAGHAVEEKDVRLDEPIKAVGEHEVPIHIHGDHYASVQVQVEALT